MTDQRLHLAARQIFERAVDQPPEEADRILSEACGNNLPLRRRVEDLLAHDQDGGAFLATPLLDNVDSWIGRQLGAYQIREEIGRGGMSRVFAAERFDGEFQHSVAIKVQRDTLSWRGLDERMRAERQILADLAHPAISRLFDGGTTEEGLPYVVMELVRGWPLDVYADHQQATIRQRIQLFVTVADAVHAAHRQLIMHCDLKPTNVLVDEEGRPKLLDFGIARWLGSRPEFRDARALTPGYASPELVNGERISTASDVYSLGVMLFELLVGQRPNHRAPGTSDEAERTLLASHLAAKADRLTCERRKTTAKGLTRTLAGDLDAVLDRCLRIDPDQRYASVEHLTDDLRRWLTGHKVAARPDRFGDATKRFVRRQPLTAAAAAIGLAIGLALLISSLTLGLRLTAQQDRAQLENQRATRVTEALVELIQLTAPDNARGTSLPTREILEQAAREAEQLHVDPVSQSQLLDHLGGLYREIGDLNEAERLLRRSLALRRQVAEPERMAGTLSALARVLGEMGSLDEAARTIAQAMAIETSDDPVALADRKLVRAHVAVRTGDLKQADLDSQEALAVLRGRGGSQRLVRALLTRTQVLYEKTQYRQAKELAEEAEALALRSFGETHSSTAAAVHARAALEMRTGDLPQARHHLVRSETLHRELFGDEHPLIAEVLMVRGQIEDQSGDYAAALVSFEESAKIRRRRLGANHPLVAVAVSDAAVALYRLGRYQDASAYFSQALDIRRDSLPAGHPSIAQAINGLAGARQAAGEFMAARDLYREALAISLDIHGPEHADVASYHHNLAWMERNLGRLQAAEQQYRKALGIWVAGLGLDHPLVAMARHNLGWMLTADPERRSEAEVLLRQALGARVRTFGEHHPSVADSRVALAELLRLEGHKDDALQIFGSALEDYRRALPERHWKIAMAQSVRGALAAAGGDWAKAESLLQQASDDLERILGAEAVATREAVHRAGLALG